MCVVKGGSLYIGHLTPHSFTRCYSFGLGISCKVGDLKINLKKASSVKKKGSQFPDTDLIL